MADMPKTVKHNTVNFVVDIRTISQQYLDKTYSKTIAP